MTSKARVLNSRASWGAWASLNSRSVLATGSDIDDAIRLWDPTTGEMLAHNTGEGQRPVGPTGWGKWGRVKGRLVLAAAGIPWGATKYFNGSSIFSSMSWRTGLGLVARFDAPARDSQGFVAELAGRRELPPSFDVLTAMGPSRSRTNRPISQTRRGSGHRFDDGGQAPASCRRSAGPALVSRQAR